MKALPSFSDQVEEVKSYNYHTSILPGRSIDTKSVASVDGSSAKQGSRPLTSARNICALCVGLYLGLGFVETVWSYMLAASIITLLLMNINTDSKFFGRVKIVCCAAMGVSFGGLLWVNGMDLIRADSFLAQTIGFGVCSFIVFCVVFSKLNAKTGNIKRMLIRVSGCGFCFCVALLLLSFCHGFIGLPYTIVMIVIEVLYIPCALICAFFPEAG